MEEQLLPAQKAQMANQIAELDEQIANIDGSLTKLEQLIAASKGRKLQSYQNEIPILRQQRSKLFQEANTLRAQLGLPLVIPATSPQPQVTQVIVQQPKRGGCLRNIFIAFCLLVVLMFIVVAANNGNKSATQVTSTATSTTKSISQTDNNSNNPTATSEPTVQPSFNVGDDVQVDEVRWKIIDVKDEGQVLKSGNQFIDDKKTSGRFIRVSFEMENLSKEMLTFGGIDLVDSQGREYKESSDTLMFVPEAQLCPFIENLNPNVPKTCQLIFEVPANAERLQAKVGDLKLLGNAEELINLGL